MFLLLVDPNSVVAGWIPLVLTLLLAGICVLLGRSMRAQMRRIHIPPDGVPTHGADAHSEPTESSAAENSPKGRRSVKG